MVPPGMSRDSLSYQGPHSIVRPYFCQLHELINLMSCDKYVVFVLYYMGNQYGSVVYIMKEELKPEGCEFS